MPYIKAVIISELQNDVEIYRYINQKDIQFKNELSENFLNGLRGGMNELFTDFQKQFEKLKTSQGMLNQSELSLDFGEEKQRQTKEKSNNYQVSIMYDQYFVRKKEIANNILMIVICDVQQDGTSSTSDYEVPVVSSSFNVGQVDILFDDYQADFSQLQESIDDISKQISNMWATMN